MNPHTFLLLSKDPDLKQLLQIASPYAKIIEASTVSEGLRLRSEVSPTLIIGEGNSHTLAPLLAYAHQTPESPTHPGDRQSAFGQRCRRAHARRRGRLPHQPILLNDLQTAMARILSHPSLPASSSSLDPFASIISASPQMNLIKQLAKEVASTDATVLITGESGTGKELFADAIHRSSPRATGPLVALNCAGIPENLLESELFGYESGAFTDAKRAKLGRFQLAEGGTLFLDEIGEMSSTAQAKLLRVLENHTIDPLGDTRSHTINIRIIAATNEDLLAQIKAGRFRLDLYYRLNVYQLRIPPLRERLDDIEPILLIFLERVRKERGCRIKTIAPSALAVLQNHDWPGNVRELHNVVEWLTITCKDDVIQPHHLPTSVKTSSSTHQIDTEPKPSLLAFGLSFQEM
ncbi:MAG: sigma-54-dependent Fis family transcriptional regulator, partial [Nitrospira sp.]|nr:sigma-54-dependent Fis family transcriptional regulator [Nitrospira sp.]